MTDDVQPRRACGTRWDVGGAYPQAHGAEHACALPHPHPETGDTHRCACGATVAGLGLPPHRVTPGAVASALAATWDADALARLARECRALCDRYPEEGMSMRQAFKAKLRECADALDAAARTALAAEARL